MSPRKYSTFQFSRTLALSAIIGVWSLVSSFQQTSNRIARSPTKCSSEIKRCLFLSTKPNLDNNLINVGNRDNNYPSNNLTYLRWNKEGDTWKIQTAVMSFQRGETIVDLHAQLHFADIDYFNYYNTPEFTKDLDHVHYELLVDQDLLEYDVQAQTTRWRVKAPIMASQNDQNLAKSYGWSCQASQIDYRQPDWIHADMTRQEFLQLVESNPSAGASQPLWKLASPHPQSSSAAAEAVSALFIGPPQLSYSQSFIKRRLFTNLFLPGSKLANVLRALLWMTVPAPELSVILLDWSSILSGNGRPSRVNYVNPSALSEVAWPIFSSLAKLDITSIRRFWFGQVLVTANSYSRSAEQDQAWSILVTKRNDRALDVLRNTLQGNSNEKVHTALLYGCSHCSDLHAKLVTDGFTPVNTTWRTAWSVQEESQDNFAIVPVLTLLLMSYLSVGALDWIGMLGEVSKVWEAEQDNYLNAVVVALLYLLRHVLLYLGLSKFLVDWTNSKD